MAWDTYMGYSFCKSYQKLPSGMKPRRKYGAILKSVNRTRWHPSTSTLRQPFLSSFRFSFFIFDFSNPTKSLAGSYTAAFLCAGCFTPSVSSSIVRFSYLDLINQIHLKAGCCVLKKKVLSLQDSQLLKESLVLSAISIYS